MRRGEAAALAWRNVDFNRDTVTYAVAAKQVGKEIITGPTKSRKSRVVALGRTRWRNCEAGSMSRRNSYFDSVHDRQAIRLSVPERTVGASGLRKSL